MRCRAQVANLGLREDAAAAQGEVLFCKEPNALVRCRAQVANPDFFLKTLPLFDAGDDVGMVLSPQCFHNIDAHADIFNHGNVQFWEYAQVGYDAIGFISCTGVPRLVHVAGFGVCLGQDLPICGLFLHTLF